MESLNAKCDGEYINLVFLQNKIAQLHRHRGCYLSEEFVKTVFHIYNTLSQIMYEHAQFIELDDKKPELLSDSMVEMCIVCIETSLQELIDNQHQKTKPQILTALAYLARSLYDLSFCIKYSLIRKVNTIGGGNG